MRRLLTPLWLLALASVLAWPPFGPRELRPWGVGPSIGASLPAGDVAAHGATPMYRLLAELAEGRGAAPRHQGAAGAAAWSPVAAALPPAGAVRAVAGGEATPPRAATQRHFPRFPTGPPAVRPAR